MKNLQKNVQDSLSCKGPPQMDVFFHYTMAISVAQDVFGGMTLRLADLSFLSCIARKKMIY
jgi:hypothetical protein